MSKLDDAISLVATILDHLVLLREIENKGDCNDCKRMACSLKPRPGQMVRYNCPYYKEDNDE